MPRRSQRAAAPDQDAARQLLDQLWRDVAARAEIDPAHEYITDRSLQAVISASINHPQVSYRFCLPVQLLGKLVDSALDPLSLQRSSTGPRPGAWDARSLAKNVVAPFNLAQEGVLGTSTDPYVGNAMRIPRMTRNDPSKRDQDGWNRLIGVLEEVQRRDDRSFTDAAFKQVLLEMLRRQSKLRFAYPIPLRVSLEVVLSTAARFLEQRSGGDRALALAGALFDVIGDRFRLYVRVNRARINATDLASGQAADLECIDLDGRVVLAVEVKDRDLTLADVEGTIGKARSRAITEVLFAVPQCAAADAAAIEQRFSSAYAAGQSLYRSDFFSLARAVLALTGDSGRVEFLRRVGEHLDRWNTQPSHRQAWKSLLEAI